MAECKAAVCTMCIVNKHVPLAADCPGFVQQHETPGSSKNVAHFQQMLQKYGSVAEDKTSVAWWLTRQAPQVCASHTHSTHSHALRLKKH